MSHLQIGHSRETLAPLHAPPDNPSITVTIGTPLSLAARELILSTLEYCGGERKRTAEMLGICTKTLYKRLREYGIRVGQDPSAVASIAGDS
jgi:DNA-binding NtrC family response regulator